MQHDQSRLQSCAGSSLEVLWLSRFSDLCCQASFFHHRLKGGFIFDRNDREKQHAEEHNRPLSANYLTATGSKTEEKPSPIIDISQLD